MSRDQFEQDMLDGFYDQAVTEYRISAFNSDGKELAYVRGCDYEDLAENARLIPDFTGQTMYELSAVTNGQEVNGKVSKFTVDHCLEDFMKVEAVVNEEIVAQFYAMSERDYDSEAKELRYAR